jgi:hypothetical protein
MERSISQRELVYLNGATLDAMEAGGGGEQLCPFDDHLPVLRERDAGLAAAEYDFPSPGEHDTLPVDDGVQWCSSGWHGGVSRFAQDPNHNWTVGCTARECDKHLATDLLG